MVRRFMLLLVIVACIVGWNNYSQRGSALSFPPREGQPQIGGAPLSGGDITIEPTEPGEVAPPSSEWQPAISISGGHAFAWKNGEGNEVVILFEETGGQPAVHSNEEGDWQVTWVNELNSYHVTRDGTLAFFIIPHEGKYSIGRSDRGSRFKIVR